MPNGLQHSSSFAHTTPSDFKLLIHTIGDRKRLAHPVL